MYVVDKFLVVCDLVRFAGRFALFQMAFKSEKLVKFLGRIGDGSYRKSPIKLDMWSA